MIFSLAIFCEIKERYYKNLAKHSLNIYVTLYQQNAGRAGHPQLIPTFEQFFWRVWRHNNKGNILKMKIQLETREENADKPNFTYISYSNYKAVIPKAPEHVRLSDIKDAFLEKADLEYYFKTKNNSGKIISIEVDKNDQAIPLLDGAIKVETFPKKTEVCFRLRDQERFRIINYYFGSLDHGIIPKSAKKPKTLGDVRKVVPTFLQQIFKGGKTIKYFFEDNANGERKELILDSEELPTINGRKTIICWIMVSQDIGKKLSQRRNYMRYSILITFFLILSVGLTCSICLPTMNYISEGAGLILGFITILLSSVILSAGACVGSGCSCGHDERL